jgi:hypothetical protein
MGTPTETTLARRWVVQVNMATDVSPDWQLLPAITDYTWKADPVIDDDSTYDQGGWMANAKTGQSWSADASFNRKATPDSTAYSPVHEKLRLAAFAFGAASKVGIRWYDRDSLPEAYQGTALVTWTPSGGDRTKLENIKATLTGTGILVPITNPLLP